MILASRIRTVLVAAAALVALGATPAAAVPVTGPEFGPSVVMRELHLQRSEPGARVTVHWRGPNRTRVLHWFDLDPVDDRGIIEVVGDTTRFSNGTPRRATSSNVLRNTTPGQPDGYDELDGNALRYAWSLVARQRSGESALREVVVGGRTLLRGTTVLAANECGGLKAGVRIVHLDPRTLVPVRVVERRGGVVDWNATFGYLRPRASDFGRIRYVGTVHTDDLGFRRRGAAAVAASVTYPISLPTTLPVGYGLTAVGNAPMGSHLGPEGSFPRSRGVFIARWSRGLEDLSLSIRPAHGTLVRDWTQSDPMGVECGPNRSVAVQVGPHAGRYANDEFSPPRLWWRDGTTLYALVGPFSAEQLVAVATSLTPVADA